jgi:hypothetical protein
MPFYEATGRDIQTYKSRSLQISARSETEAIDTAALQGITEIKLRPYSDREMLMLDFKCFLNAGPGSPARRKRTPRLAVSTTDTPAYEQTQPHHELRSLLIRHPILTITICMLLAIWIDRVALQLLSMI